MFSLHQDLAQDCSWEWFFTGVGQFAAVGCLCVHTWDFFPGGLYRINYWVVVWCLASGCVFEWGCTSMSIVGWGEGRGLRAVLIFLGLLHSSCLEWLLLHRPWWACRECAGNISHIHPGFSCVKWKCGTYFPSAHLLGWIMRGKRGGFLAHLFWCRDGGLIFAFLLLHRDFILKNHTPIFISVFHTRFLNISGITNV